MQELPDWVCSVCKSIKRCLYEVKKKIINLMRIAARGGDALNHSKMKRVNKQCLLDTPPPTVRVSE